MSINTPKSFWRSPWQILITAIALFLIVYHAARIVTEFTTVTELTLFAGLQLAIRIAIVLSLASVIFRKKWGLLAMWLTIGTLVAVQIVYLSQAPWSFDASYLRGLILPAVLTVLSLLRQKQGSIN